VSLAVKTTAIPIGFFVVVFGISHKLFFLLLNEIIKEGDPQK
jgi:hypothetical protein